MRMADPWSIIASILFLMGVLYYRHQYMKYKKQYYNLINPKPVERQFKSQKEIDREKYEKIRSQILLRDHFRCQECGYYKHLEVHHIIPRSKGGSDDPSNLITLCTRCHGKKHGFKKRENRRARRARRNRRKKEKRWLNKHRNNLKREPFIEDFSGQNRIASPERRRELYEQWNRDELNQPQ
jgi:5-methylcytosine-specific restriction endonuclease McrA